jgi:hypothetical protein
MFERPRAEGSRGCRFRSALIEMSSEPVIVAGGREVSIEGELDG